MDPTNFWSSGFFYFPADHDDHHDVLHVTDVRSRGLQTALDAR